MKAELLRLADKYDSTIYAVDSNRKVYHLISVFFVILTFKLHSDQK